METRICKGCGTKFDLLANDRPRLYHNFECKIKYNNRIKVIKHSKLYRIKEKKNPDEITIMKKELKVKKEEEEVNRLVLPIGGLPISPRDDKKTPINFKKEKNTNYITKFQTNELLYKEFSIAVKNKDLKIKEVFSEFMEWFLINY